MADREFRRHRRNLIWQKILTGGVAAVFFALVNMMILPGAELEVRATEVRSTDTKCILTYDDEDENLKGTTVEVMISEVVNTDSEYSIKQSEAGKALCMLKEVSEDQFTNLAFPIYDIKILSNGAEKKPASEVTVKIQLPASEYSAGDVKTVVHFTGNGIRTIKGEVVSDGVNLYMSFKTKTFSDFMITDIEGVESNIWIVENGDELRRAIEDTTFNGTIVIDAKGDGKEFDVEYTNGAPKLYRSLIINLNSHHITVNDTFIDILGGELTITDNSVIENVNDVTASKAKYGNQAFYDSNTNTLTYYVTKPELSVSEVGVTTESVKEHVVTGTGTITGTKDGHAVFYLDVGKLTIENGMIAGSHSRAVYMQGSSTLDIKGGYLCGNNKDTNADGGAVFADGVSCNVKMSGGVIAGNTAKNGGAIYLASAPMNMTGGIISGNVATVDGGGIFVNGSGNFTMSDAAIPADKYITNNISSLLNDYNNRGGGGVVMGGDGTFEFNKGYITGNLATGGGGIYIIGSGAEFVMNGGYVTANHAVIDEGGGIRVGAGSLADFNAGYITNNETETKQHWGGGGIFIAEGAYGYAEKVLVKNNSAGGFGGGVAGCSTGQIYMSDVNAGTTGVAIYSNVADGSNFSGGTSAKHDDHSYAKNDTVFTSNGYKDYFSMLYSHITDVMLGGGSHNWSGSIDGNPIERGKIGASAISNSVAGLKSNAVESDIQLAEVPGVAAVYVTGNTSYTHGGGILCNGYMIFGTRPDQITASTRFELHGTVQYLNWASNPIAMSDNQFTFEMASSEDFNSNNIITTGSNYANGEITFKHRVTFANGGNYIYFVQQTTPDFANGEIDRAKYKVTVEVLANEESTEIPIPTADKDLNYPDKNKIKVSMRKIHSVLIEKWDDSSNAWINPVNANVDSSIGQYNHAVAVYLRDPSDSSAYSFTNYNLTVPVAPPAGDSSGTDAQPSTSIETPDVELSEEVSTQTAEGELPQTGQNWMSVILLACAGCLCFIIGIALKRVEHEWD